MIRNLSIAWVALFATTPMQAVDRPNIVLILADDLGWTDLAIQGSKYYRTPNIDRMAARGMRFTNAYTCGPNCQPTRAAIMSGQYGPRTGVYTVGSTDRFDTSRRPLAPVENVEQLPLEKITIADALAKAGYATGMFGKWHLGNGRFGPDRRGFAETFVSMGKHFDFASAPPTTIPPGKYLADYLTDRALDFIDRHKAGPFFLYLPHFAVHSPHQAKPEWIAKFKDAVPSNGHRDPTYAAMIASVDESVGRVLDKLAELKLDRKTLVIFSSDNGGVGGYRQAGIEAKEGVTNNAPLRGGKGMLYEGGIRVPFIAYCPGLIPVGKLCDEPILSVDYFPTFLNLAAAPPPDNYSLDGTSIVPLLVATDKVVLNRPAIYWHFPGYLGSGKDVWRTTPAGAVRMGDFKLIEFFEDGRIELYNLHDDIGERNNLVSSMPAKARELHDRLKAWRKEINAPMPAHRDPNAPAVQKPSRKGKRAAKKARNAGEDD